MVPWGPSDPGPRTTRPRNRQSGSAPHRRTGSASLLADPPGAETRVHTHTGPGSGQPSQPGSICSVIGLPPRASNVKLPTSPQPSRSRIPLARRGYHDRGVTRSQHPKGRASLPASRGAKRRKGSTRGVAPGRPGTLTPVSARREPRPPTGQILNPPAPGGRGFRTVRPAFLTQSKFQSAGRGASQAPQVKSPSLTMFRCPQSWQRRNTISLVKRPG